jgi:hypothetical protein
VVSGCDLVERSRDWRWLRGHPNNSEHRELFSEFCGPTHIHRATRRGESWAPAPLLAEADAKEDAGRTSKKATETKKKLGARCCQLKINRASGISIKVFFFDAVFRLGCGLNYIIFRTTFQKAKPLISLVGVSEITFSSDTNTDTKMIWKWCEDEVKTDA